LSIMVAGGRPIQAVMACKCCPSACPGATPWSYTSAEVPSQHLVPTHWKGVIRNHRVGVQCPTCATDAPGSLERRASGVTCRLLRCRAELVLPRPRARAQAGPPVVLEGWMVAVRCWRCQALQVMARADECNYPIALWWSTPQQAASHQQLSIARSPSVRKLQAMSVV
jgi:hypothetical protein